MNRDAAIDQDLHDINKRLNALAVVAYGMLSVGELEMLQAISCGYKEALSTYDADLLYRLCAGGWVEIVDSNPTYAATTAKGDALLVLVRDYP